MTAIQTVGTVGPDRKLTIEVPQDVPEGRHRVVVLLETETSDAESEAGSRLAWEGNVLVFTGRGSGTLDIGAEIEHNRERRMIDVCLGSDG